MNHKGLSTVATFTGKSSDYEVWASKMRNLLCQSSQDYKYVIKFVEEQSDDFINDEYVKYLRQYNLDANRALELAEQMWFVIAAKTDGQAYHLLRFLEGNEDGHRGVMAWYRLRSSAMGVSTNRLQALNARVNTPERVEKLTFMRL